MAITDRNILKNWFVRGAKPLASQFASWIDSFWHKYDSIPIESVSGLGDILADKIDRKEIENISQNLLLERRIQLTMESASQSMLIGEEMTIYRVEASNVASLTMTIGSTITPIGVNTGVSVTIPAGAIPTFTVVTLLTDSTAFLYIKAKIKSL